MISVGIVGVYFRKQYDLDINKTDLKSHLRAIM
jgi:hypothetical protein